MCRAASRNTGMGDGAVVEEGLGVRGDKDLEENEIGVWGNGAVVEEGP